MGQRKGGEKAFLVRIKQAHRTCTEEEPEEASAVQLTLENMDTNPLEQSRNHI